VHNQPPILGRRSRGDHFTSNGWRHAPARRTPAEHYKDPQGLALAGRLAILALVALALTLLLLWIGALRTQATQNAGWTWDEAAEQA